MVYYDITDYKGVLYMLWSNADLYIEDIPSYADRPAAKDLLYYARIISEQKSGAAAPLFVFQNCIFLLNQANNTLGHEIQEVLICSVSVLFVCWGQCACC